MKNLKKHVDNALDDASQHPLATQSLSFMRRACLIVWYAPALFSGLFGLFLLGFVGEVVPLVLTIFSKGFGGFGLAVLRILGSFIQICGIVSGCLSLYAAVHAFRNGSK